MTTEKVTTTASTLDGLKQLGAKYPKSLDPDLFGNIAHISDVHFSSFEQARRVIGSKASLLVFAIDDIFDKKPLSAQERIVRRERYGEIVRGAEVVDTDDEIAHLLGETRADLVQFTSFSSLESAWVSNFGKMIRGMEKELDFTSATPSYDEYMQAATDSIGVSFYLVTSLILYDSPQVATKLGILEPVFEKTAIAIRLVNDLRSYEREKKEGKINSVSLEGESPIRERMEKAYQEASGLLQSLTSRDELPEQDLKNLLDFVIGFYLKKDFRPQS